MSRTTVREALRILEVQGLVSIRTGRSGGAFVQQPDGTSVATSVSLLIRGQQLRLRDLLETREAIEPACAGLAARYRTDDDLAALDATRTPRWTPSWPRTSTGTWPPPSRATTSCSPDS